MDNANTQLSAIAWMYEHPDLLRSIIARSSGAIGELYVSKKLQELGYAVRPASINARQCDLLVTSPMSNEFHIEVKTVKDKGAPYLVRQCPDEKASSIWIFVHAPRQFDGLPADVDVSYRILTTTEASSIWRSKYDGRPNKAPDITWRDLEATNRFPDPHLDRWDKLLD